MYDWDSGDSTLVSAVSTSTRSLDRRTTGSSAASSIYKIPFAQKHLHKELPGQTCELASDTTVLDHHPVPAAPPSKPQLAYRSWANLVSNDTQQAAAPTTAPAKSKSVVWRLGLASWTRRKNLKRQASVARALDATPVELAEHNCPATARAPDCRAGDQQAAALQTYPGLWLPQHHHHYAATTEGVFQYSQQQRYSRIGPQPPCAPHVLPAAQIQIGPAFKPPMPGQACFFLTATTTDFCTCKSTTGLESRAEQGQNQNQNEHQEPDGERARTCLTNIQPQFQPQYQPQPRREREEPMQALFESTQLQFLSYCAATKPGSLELAYAKSIIPDPELLRRWELHGRQHGYPVLANQTLFGAIEADLARLARSIISPPKKAKGGGSSARDVGLEVDVLVYCIKVGALENLPAVHLPCFAHLRDHYYSDDLMPSSPSLTGTERFEEVLRIHVLHLVHAPEDTSSAEAFHVLSQYAGELGVADPVKEGGLWEVARAWVDRDYTRWRRLYESEKDAACKVMMAQGELKMAREAIPFLGRTAHTRYTDSNSHGYANSGANTYAIDGVAMGSGEGKKRVDRDVDEVRDVLGQEWERVLMRLGIRWSKDGMSRVVLEL